MRHPIGTVNACRPGIAPLPFGVTAKLPILYTYDMESAEGRPPDHGTSMEGIYDDDNTEDAYTGTHSLLIDTTGSNLKKAYAIFPALGGLKEWFVSYAMKIIEYSGSNGYHLYDAQTAWPFTYFGITGDNTNLYLNRDFSFTPELAATFPIIVPIGEWFTFAVYRKPPHPPDGEDGHTAAWLNGELKFINWRNQIQDYLYLLWLGEMSTTARLKAYIDDIVIAGR